MSNKIKDRDYREKEVKGILCEAEHMKYIPTNVTVRMTSDKLGQSLSLSAFNVMIEIPLEEVEDIIVLAERGRE